MNKFIKYIHFAEVIPITSYTVIMIKVENPWINSRNPMRSNGSKDHFQWTNE